MDSDDAERRPPRGAPDEAGRPVTTVRRGSDTAEQRRAIERAAEVRTVLRRAFPLACGCPSPREHVGGCSHGLDPASRSELYERLILDPFPAPRLAADEELALINRIRTDRRTAEVALARFTELLLGEAGR